jgi:tungstate transport system substrate-binding protein
MKKLFILMIAVAMSLEISACRQVISDEPESSVAIGVTETSLQKENNISTKNPVIRLSTTTSVNDSGLMSYLQPYFESDTGYELEITSAGSGAAIEKARKGDADCLLVHSKLIEEEFVNEGYGEKRVPFMYNYFVIFGPKDDPAGIRNLSSSREALKAIADAGSTFVSRGDNSGTYNKELMIWKAIGYNPDGQSWYVSIGGGMGQAITFANEKQAYLLSDKSTILMYENISLVILMAESDDMKNMYSLIAVTPSRWPDTNYEGSLAFIKWMKSDRALDLIDEYGVDKYSELFLTLR